MPAAIAIAVDAVAITMAAARGVVARANALSSRRSSLVSVFISAYLLNRAYEW